MSAVDGFSIGEVAERTGVSVHALRYYERQGLFVVDVPRTGSGHRRYSADEVEWIEVCCSLRQSGMPIEGLREYVELVKAGPGNEEQRLALLRRHAQRVETELQVLQSSLALIRYKVSFYEERIAEGTAAAVWAGESGPGDQAAAAELSKPHH
jgi:DNA-binding transcriptional MerR regulator